MIRYRLATLSSLAVVIGFITVVWLRWRDYIWLENGNLLIYTDGGRDRFYRPSRYSDPVGLSTFIRVPI